MSNLFIVEALHYMGINKPKDARYWCEVSTAATKYKCRKFIQLMKSLDGGQAFRNGLPFYVKYKLKPAA